MKREIRFWTLVALTTIDESSAWPKITAAETIEVNQAMAESFARALPFC
jgi:hypothetical protein